MYDPQDNYQLYVPRTAEFVTAGEQAQAKPAIQDDRKVALVLVDCQQDFIHPTGNLPVTDAPAALQRIVEFIYRYLESITSIFASLDTHNTFQIFFPSWWAYVDNGEHPNPYTMVRQAASGELMDMNGRRIKPLIDPLWSIRTYVPLLKANAAKDLMLWPYHCMEGTQGQALMPSLAEALAYYSAARLSQVNYLNKGRCPRTEHFGIWAAEVADPRDPSTSMNTVILDLLGQHDLLYVAGFAKSHCVLETMKQTVTYFKNQPEILRKIRFLMDCTSSVQTPGIDFDGLANAELAKMEKQGVVLVNSTDPIA